MLHDLSQSNLAELGRRVRRPSLAELERRVQQTRPQLKYHEMKALLLGHARPRMELQKD
jgi:hypothetical protein